MSDAKESEEAELLSPEEIADFWGLESKEDADATVHADVETSPAADVSKEAPSTPPQSNRIASAKPGASKLAKAKAKITSEAPSTPPLATKPAEGKPAAATAKPVGKTLDRPGTGPPAKKVKRADGVQDDVLKSAMANWVSQACGEGAPKGGSPSELGDAAEAPQDAAPAPKKVKLKKSVTDKVKDLNASSEFIKPIRLGVVAGPLSALDEALSLKILTGVADAGETEDPTAWICEAAKGAAEEARVWAEWEDQEWTAWEEKETKIATERYSPLDEVVKAAVKRLNRSEVLAEPLRLAHVAGALSLLENGPALELLGELEARAEEITHPNGFISGVARRKAGPVMGQVYELNRGGQGKMDLLSPIAAEKVRGPLNMVSESAALKLLRKLEHRALDIKDPTSWIIEHAKKCVTPLAEKCKKLNDSGQLNNLIRISRVVEELQKCKPAEADRILFSVKKRARTLRDATSWIMAQVKITLEPKEATEAPWKLAKAKPKGAKGQKRKKDQASEETPAAADGEENDEADLPQELWDTVEGEEDDDGLAEAGDANVGEEEGYADGEEYADGEDDDIQ